jgi:hypothetical protein
MLEIDSFKYRDTTSLKLFGEVEIENGDTKINGRNHWVGAGLGTLAAFIGSTSGASVNATTSNWYIFLGLDTTTATNVTMSSLAKPILTQPNVKLASGSYIGGSTNAVSVRYASVWLPGTVSGTIGEVGLYLTLSGGNYPIGNPGMVARLSVADGSFTAFTVNTSKTLSIYWDINLVYV